MYIQRLWLVFFFLMIAFVTRAQDDAFIAKPYLQIGRQPSATSLELMWQAPDMAAEWAVEVRTTPSGKWVKAGAPEFVAAVVDSAKARRVYHALLSGWCRVVHLVTGC